MPVPAGGKIVIDDHGPGEVFVQEVIDDVATDEAGAPYHQNSHDQGSLAVPEGWPAADAAPDRVVARSGP